VPSVYVACKSVHAGAAGADVLQAKGATSHLNDHGGGLTVVVMPHGDARVVRTGRTLAIDHHVQDGPPCLAIPGSPQVIVFRRLCHVEYGEPGKEASIICLLFACRILPTNL